VAQKTVIGNLQVRLTAITSGFTKGMFEASDSLRKFARVANTDVLKAIPRLAGNLTGLLANAFLSIPRLAYNAVKSLLSFAKTLSLTVVAGATAAAGALLYLTKQSFASIDALRVQAVKLDVSTKFFGALEVAADGAGVSMESATNAITKVTRAISDAAIKGGPAKDALREIGLSVYQLARLDAAGQFNAISEAFGKISNQSDKIRIAVALFGKSGAEILPLFSENMQEAAKWAKILNLEISDFDAAQVDAAGDSVSLLGKAFKGVGNYLATNLAPIITGVTQNILSFIAAQGGVAAIVERVMKGAAAIAVEALNRIGAAAQGVANFAGDIGLDASVPGDAIRFASKGIADLTRSVFYLGAAFNAVWQTFKLASISALTGAVGLVDMLIKGINAIPGIKIDTTFIDAFALDLGKQTEEAATKAAAAWRVVFGGQLYKTAETVGTAIEGVGEKAAGIADMGVKFVAQGFDDWAEALKNLGLEDIEALINRISVRVEDTSDQLKKDDFFNPNKLRGDGPSDKIFNLTDRAKKQQEALADEITRIWARTGDSISDSLADAIFEGENLFKSLANTAKDVAKQIFSAFLNKMFITPIINAFTGGTGGGFASFLSGTSAGMSGIASPTSGLAMAGAGGGTVNNFHFYEPVVGDKNALAREIDKQIRTPSNQSYMGDVAAGKTSSIKARRPRQAMVGS